MKLPNCNKVIIMCDIKKSCLYIFSIIIFIAMWGDGQMVKALGCGQPNRGSNPILDMYLYWFLIRWL
jgi:hypothetical protein